jgi:hypothetical protein
MSIAVEAVQSKQAMAEFIELPWKIYHNDPAWVPPLRIEREEHFDAKKNPFFQHAEVQLFLARNPQREVVGRISAQLNFEHNRIYGEGTGFFGCFEAFDSHEVAAALFQAAEKWCRDRGCSTIRGPFSFSINDDCGVLIDGFETPPYVLMGHSPRYYAALHEASGYTKIKDLLAWHYKLSEPDPMVLEIADNVEKAPGLVVRNINMSRLEEDVRSILDVFNEAWSKNWGFVPLTEAEILKMSKDLKLIADPELIKIAEVNGKVAAVALALPNVHEAIQDLNGSLFPTGIFKLLYRLKTHKIKGVRMVILGVKKEFRGGIFQGGGLSVLLYVRSYQAAVRLGYQFGEGGWTLEDNEKINQGIMLMGGVRYKTYRIYEKALLP